MKKIIALLASTGLALVLTSCGYDGHYRYPCQDSANWDAKECNPPVCETTGTCTKDIIGQDAWDKYKNGEENE